MREGTFSTTEGAIVVVASIVMHEFARMAAPSLEKNTESSYRWLGAIVPLYWPDLRLYTFHAPARQCAASALLEVHRLHAAAREAQETQEVGRCRWKHHRGAGGPLHLLQYACGECVVGAIMVPAHKCLVRRSCFFTGATCSVCGDRPVIQRNAMFGGVQPTRTIADRTASIHSRNCHLNFEFLETLLEQIDATVNRAPAWRDYMLRSSAPSTTVRSRSGTQRRATARKLSGLLRLAAVDRRILGLRMCSHCLILALSSRPRCAPTNALV